MFLSPGGLFFRRYVISMATRRMEITSPKFTGNVRWSFLPLQDGASPASSFLPSAFAAMKDRVHVLILPSPHRHALEVSDWTEQ